PTPVVDWILRQQEPKGVTGQRAPAARAPGPYLRVNSAISYEVDPAWPERRKDIVWGDMSSVAVDGHDQGWGLSRARGFVRVYQAGGKFQKAWGDGLLDGPHMLALDRQGNVWITDTIRHVIIQCSPDGKLLRTLGIPDEPGCDEGRFNRPTDVVVTPAG